MISNITFSKHGVNFTAKVPKLANWLMWRNAKNVSPTNDVDRCDHGIKRSTWQANVFVNCEVGFRFVKAETKMKLVDVIQGCVEEAELVVDKEIIFVKENEVLFNESEGMVCPDTSITRIGDASVACAGRFARTGLAVLGNARACKDSKADPIIDRID